MGVHYKTGSMYMYITYYIDYLSSRNFEGIYIITINFLVASQMFDVTHLLRLHQATKARTFQY